MTLTLARKASAILALIVAGPALADNVDVGYVLQTSPKPSILYVGPYSSFISSSLVENPTQRTVVTLDLYGIMQSAGYSWIERIEVLDGGGNAYGGSPGADLDYWSLEGAGSTTISFSYVGANPTHVGESSSSLATRVGALDAMTGDQDFSVQHFVSLGLGGTLVANFQSLAAPGGSGGSGGSGSPGGGSTPGQGWGGGTTTPQYTNLLQVLPGLKLHLSEAGLTEGYAIRLVGASVPAPAVLSLLGGSACFLRRGRRRFEQVVRNS